MLRLAWAPPGLPRSSSEGACVLAGLAEVSNALQPGAARAPGGASAPGLRAPRPTRSSAAAQPLELFLPPLPGSLQWGMPRHCPPSATRLRRWPGLVPQHRAGTGPRQRALPTQGSSASSPRNQGQVTGWPGTLRSSLGAPARDRSHISGRMKGSGQGSRALHASEQGGRPGTVGGGGGREGAGASHVARARGRAGVEVEAGSRGSGVAQKQAGGLAAPTPASATGDVLVSADGISKTHDGERMLFEDLSLTVAQGQRLGLLGPNGSGKSTLLRILAGADTPDSGRVQRKRGVRIGYLPQDPPLEDDLSILDAVLAAPTPVMAAVREYERALALLDGKFEGGEGEGALPPKEKEATLQRAMEKVEALGAWDVASEARRLLALLGVGDLDKKVSQLSGGQRKRVALAATMLARPELLLLDEPTNHMDVAVIEWMETALTAPGLTVLLITHDRFFLDRVCGDMLELDGRSGARHQGNYSAFLANKAQREAAEAALIGRAQTVLKKEAEWMRRQPKARSTKSRSRIERFYALTKVAQGRRGVPQPGSVADMAGVGGGESRLGSKVLVLQGATACRGPHRVFQDFTFEFGKKERIGVVGRNGAGKTTFLDALAGELPLLEGSRDVGDTVVFGYYTQHTPPIPEQVRVIDYLREFAPAPTAGPPPASTLSPASSALGGDLQALADAAVSRNRNREGERAPLDPAVLLEQFGFPRSRQHTLVASLSGGEKRRLYLATVLLQRPNFLLLDEPTNDLDLSTIQVLEDFLATFEGCVVVASHDRAFMDNVVERQFVLEGDGEVELYDGLYSEYLDDAKERALEEQRERQQQQQAEQQVQVQGSPKGAQDPNAAMSAPPSKGKSGRRLSYMERKEYERLEGEIEQLGRRKETLEAQITEASTAADYDALARLSAKLASVVESIDQKTDRWLELAEIAE